MNPTFGERATVFMSFAGSQLSSNLSKRSSTWSEAVVCVSRDVYIFGVWHAPNGSVMFPLVDMMRSCGSLVERRLARAKAMDLPLPREYVDITSTVGRNLYFLSLWMRCVFYVVISLYPRPMMNQDRSL